MEVRFRPLQPSTLARRLSPGKAPSEEAQSFFEVVESLTAASNSPEEYAGSGQKEETTKQRPSNALPHAPSPAEEDLKAEKPAAPPTEKSEKDKPLGIRIDVTA